MKLSAAIIGLAACAMADLRLATPFGPPPPLPSESDHSSPKLPTSASSHASVVSAHPMAVVPDRGPICKCGYTYCASVLMAMSTHTCLLQPSLSSRTVRNLTDLCACSPNDRGALDGQGIGARILQHAQGSVPPRHAGHQRDVSPLHLSLRQPDAEDRQQAGPAVRMRLLHGSRARLSGAVRKPLLCYAVLVVKWGSMLDKSLGRGRIPTRGGA